MKAILTLALCLLVSMSAFGQDTSASSAYAFVSRDMAESSLIIYFQPARATTRISSAVIYKNGNGGFRPYFRTDSIPKCGRRSAADELCVESAAPTLVKLRFRFAKSIAATEDFRVLLKSVDSENVPPSGAESATETLTDAIKSIVTSKATIEPFKGNFGFMQVPNGPELTRTPEVQLDFEFTIKKPDDLPAAIVKEFVQDRIRDIFIWLESNVQSMKVEVEVLDGPERAVQSVIPSQFKLEPKSYSQVADKIILSLLTNQRYPNSSFWARLNAPVDRPGELQEIAKTEKSKIDPVLDAKAAEDNSKPGLALRAFDSRLNVGIMGSSAVTEKEEAGQKKVVRDQNYLLDLKLSPWRRELPGCDNTAPWFTDPIFVDALISNGKIDADSLSTNRIIVGSTVLKLKKCIKTLNLLTFTVRPQTTADRDLKQIEIKTNLEFRILLDALNQGIKTKKKFVPSVFDGGEFKTVEERSWFGFRVVPLIGSEFGYVARKRAQPFPSQESTRGISRVYFGLDAAFDLTSKLTLNFTDRFYIRGESTEARYRNLFKGGASFLVRKTANTSNYFYVEFEKGNEPPFVSRATNSVKAGLRITSNLGFRTGN